MVICLELGADLHMTQLSHCHSLSLSSVKSRFVLPFWYRLTVSSYDLSQDYLTFIVRVTYDMV